MRAKRSGTIAISIEDRALTTLAKQLGLLDPEGQGLDEVMQAFVKGLDNGTVSVVSEKRARERERKRREERGRERKKEKELE